MTDKSIGTRIRKQRELSGYTREALAEKLNVSAKFCSDIELGVKGMSVETLCRLSNVLLVTTDYILFGKNDVSYDDEIAKLVNYCPEDKRKYLKGIIRNFVQSCTAED